jgi:hypothetical protein
MASHSPYLVEAVADRVVDVGEQTQNRTSGGTARP